MIAKSMSIFLFSGKTLVRNNHRGNSFLRLHIEIQHLDRCLFLFSWGFVPCLVCLASELHSSPSNVAFKILMIQFHALVYLIKNSGLQQK